VTEKEFHKEMKRLGVLKDQYPQFLSTTHADATCHFFDRADGGKCAIVCMHKDGAKEREKDECYGLLIHEAVHIWQACREVIGEKEPSTEFEAYSVQRIAQNLIWSWIEQT
jgi:hypothetical protein